MNSPRELWKSVIHSEENMADSMRNFVDDYIFLVNYWNENENKYEDDATWIHIDEAREERLELESKVYMLEQALHLRNEEYLALADKYKQLQKQVQTLNALLPNTNTQCKEEPITKAPTEVKRLVKRKKKLIAK